MFEREIKVCGMCGEEDLIEADKIHCDDCLKKKAEMRKKILSI